MLDSSADRPSPSGFALLGSLLTVAATIGLDLAAGQELLHAILLGSLVSTVAALRGGRVGRSREFFAALTGVVVAQPALHVAMAASSPAHDVVSITDSPVTVGHVLIALLIVSAVVSSESLLLVLAAALRRTTRWLFLPRPPAEAGVDLPLPPPAARPLRPWVGRVPRRGPPRLRAAL